MLSNELLEQVKRLDEDDKLQLLRALINDPALAKYAYDPFGLRGNFDAAQIMLDELEKIESASQPEIK